MRELFLAVQKTLEVFSWLKYTDYDTGQLDRFSERAPVAFPCVLIDVAVGRATDVDTGHSVQVRTYQVNLRLALDFSPPTSSLTSAENLPDGVRFLEYTDQLYTHLQGWPPPFNAGRFSNTSIRVESRDDRIKVVNLSFICESTISA